MKKTESAKLHVLPFLLTLSLLFFCFNIPVFAGETYPQEINPVPSEDLSGKVVILHSNDVHGAIDGYAKMAALRETYESLGAEVIIADAGDFSQGETYVNLSLGEDAVTMMNAAGYTVATLGNHEFDYGYEKLCQNLQKAEFAVICANIYENGKEILPPTFMYTAESGVKIGFIGLDTEETKTKVNPNLTIGLTFYGGSEMYRIASEQAQTLRQDGADLVIALTHLGVNNESAPGGNRSLDLMKNTTGIDYILDGHSHTVMTAGSGAEAIQSTGTKFKYIGVLVVGADGTPEDHYLVDTEQIAADKSSATAVEAGSIKDRIDAVYEEKIAVSEVVFEANPKINRTRETNSGDLVTDAMLWYFSKDPSSLEVPLDHLVAAVNGGAIRAGIAQGDVVKREIKTIYPFGDTLRISYLTGTELLEVLEASTFCTPTPVGGYPQTGGISFSVDTTKEYDQGDLYPGSVYYGPKSIRRVTINSINGKPFRPEDTYALAGTYFMCSGGDTYFVLSMKDGFDTGIPMDELLIMYIQEELNGVLPASKYAEVRGDQEIILADSAASENVYQVKRGDCLWTIAEEVYGDGTKWKLIYQNNTDIIDNPSLIFPGQELKLPNAG